MSQALKNEAAVASAALESCVFRLLLEHKAGLRTGEVAAFLGIESHTPTRNANWRARTILEELVLKGLVQSTKEGSARKFRAA